MNTTAVNIRTELYNHAADYARRHNTSIDKMVESYITALMLKPAKKQKYSKFSPVVERLGNLHLREFSQEEIDEDPRLAHIMQCDEEQK